MRVAPAGAGADATESEKGEAAMPCFPQSRSGAPKRNCIPRMAAIARAYVPAIARKFLRYSQAVASTVNT